MTHIKVAELFAGVGGFRLALERNGFNIVWSNQWEPSTKTQHASQVYTERFGSADHSNEDISEVISRDVEEIPDHDMLVGGFPCQDYSVATTLHNSKGLKGKKGVLWWSIHKILETKNKKPKYLLLENVDRLLKSPAKQRGRDFAVMLKSLDDLGYAVEWRVINAADYGMPQRRKRVFFFAYHKSTDIYRRLIGEEKKGWLESFGPIAKAFPINPIAELSTVKVKGSLVSITKKFNTDGGKSPFQNTGIMIDGKVLTAKTAANYTGERTTLADILQDEKPDAEFFIQPKDAKKWSYLKGAKSIDRISNSGFAYKYTEGAMIYPDALDNASRTIITGEGGKSPSRFKHVIETPHGRRRLTPLELERLNMFPDNHTNIEGITNAKRAFFMGNALVVGIIDKLSAEFLKGIKQ